MKFNSNFKVKFSKSKKSLILISLSLWFLAGTFIVLKSGIRSDHVWYLSRWKAESRGTNPYSVTMPYGIVHSIIGKAIYFGDFGPKILMFIIFTLGLGLLILDLQIGGKLSKDRLIALVFLLPFNFYVLIIVCIFNNNDATLAGLLAITVVFIRKKMNVLAGIFFGILILIKITPLILFFTFTFFPKNKNYKFMISSGITIAIGSLATLILFGTKRVVHSMLFTLHTSSSLLSPTEAFKNLYYEHNASYSAHGYLFLIKRITQAIIIMNPIIVLVISITLFSYIYLHKLNWLFGSTIIYLCFICSFNMVHPQYLLTWLVMLISCLYEEQGLNFIKNYHPIVAFLELYTTGFYITGNYSNHLQFLYHNGGLIFAPLIIYSTYKAISFTSGEIKLNYFNPYNMYKQLKGELQDRNKV